MKKLVVPKGTSRSIRKSLGISGCPPVEPVRDLFSFFGRTRNAFTFSLCLHSPPRIQELCRKACSSAEGIRLACTFQVFQNHHTAIDTVRYSRCGVTWRQTNESVSICRGMYVCRTKLFALGASCHVDYIVSQIIFQLCYSYLGKASQRVIRPAWNPSK